MAIFKCKMCGGDLEFKENAGVAECIYCGSVQTIPTAQDEQLQSLFNRANLLRRRSEFDKAEMIYERIIQMDSTQAEAYWGLILSRFGIEYVEDPKTSKRIPTCHRVFAESILTDADYQMAWQLADPAQRRIYETEAQEINRLQLDIIAHSQKESSYDVFICYKETDETGKRTQDSVIANDIYYQLSREDMKVFYAAITLEDKLGQEYESCIFAALSSAKVMLVIGTRPEYMNAVWVRNEWSRFLKFAKKDPSKLLIPCYRDMDPYELPEEFAHLQAQDMSKIGFIADVVRGIKKVLSMNIPEEKPVQKVADSHQLLLADNAMYEGETFAGVPHGFGKAIYADNDVYEGYWSRGVRQGRGTVIWSKGGQWIGEFKENTPFSGEGVLYLTDKKLRYEGSFRDGLRNGYGKFQFTDSVYEGQWLNGKRNGQGVQIWNAGGRWEGEFRDDRFWTGNGVVYTTKDNVSIRYEGQYQNGSRNGYGKIQLTDSVYEGQWLNDKRHGQGTLVWNAGGQWSGIFANSRPWQGSGCIYYTIAGKSYRYDGEIYDGVRHGYGIMQNPDSVYEGQWLQDKADGPGNTTWYAGGQWTGEYRDGKRWTGKGVIHYTDSYYDGELKNGIRSGQGRLVWKEGGEWVGSFKNGQPWNGRGTWRYADCVETGRFLLGKCVF